jgi:hypothetical protein
MKKIILLFLIIIIINNCTVNQNTGLIKVMNKTNTTFETVSIGGVTGTYFLAGNGNADCWFFSDFNGNIRFQEYLGNYFKTSETINFKVNNSYKITISYINGFYYSVVQ